MIDLYDLENTGRTDVDFYRQLAEDLHACRIIDLGCGTGILTWELAGNSREVTGVDPAAAMLAYAKRQDSAEQVRWIEGDSSALGETQADLVLMTGNVSQALLDDDALTTTLQNIRAALRPGGYLAFESRNPTDQPWLGWNRETTFVQFASPHGPVETWLEVEAVTGEIVHLLGYNHFLNSDETVIAREVLRFRSATEWVMALEAAGFTVERSFGDWQHGPLLPSSPIMVFVARRGAATPAT